jgi:hypothetical protein
VLIGQPVGRDRSPPHARHCSAVTDSDEEDDIPKPEPLPQEWLADSQEHMSITYNTDREGKSFIFIFIFI